MNFIINEINECFDFHYFEVFLFLFGVSGIAFSLYWCIDCFCFNYSCPIYCIVMKIINIIGASTETCGTPLVTCFHVLYLLQITLLLFFHMENLSSIQVSIKYCLRVLIFISLCQMPFWNPIAELLVRPIVFLSSFLLICILRLLVVQVLRIITLI